MNLALAEFRRALDDIAHWSDTPESGSPAPALDLTLTGDAGFVLRVQAYDVADEFIETDAPALEIAVVASDEMGRELLEMTFAARNWSAAAETIRAIVSEQIAIELDYDEDEEWLGSGTVRAADLRLPSDEEHVARRSFNGTLDWPKRSTQGASSPA